MKFHLKCADNTLHLRCLNCHHHLITIWAYRHIPQIKRRKSLFTKFYHSLKIIKKKFQKLEEGKVMSSPIDVSPNIVTRIDNFCLALESKAAAVKYAYKCIRVSQVAFIVMPPLSISHTTSCVFRFAETKHLIY
jgi:hypothetical protein